jgi:hypothetical protein
MARMLCVEYTLMFPGRQASGIEIVRICRDDLRRILGIEIPWKLIRKLSP